MTAKRNALDAGDSGAVTVFIEIPQGSQNKYEVDHTSGRIYLDRMLFTSTVYPADYGFVPETLAEDGDPIDAMVLVSEPTFPGCQVSARPIGVFWMDDEHGPDAKLLCVPAGDMRFDLVRDIGDVPGHQLKEIEHFFDVYKDLEQGKSTSTRGWGDAAEAHDALADAVARYVATPERHPKEQVGVAEWANRRRAFGDHADG
jgi:inorganic pyrophosphatase